MTNTIFSNNLAVLKHEIATIQESNPFFKTSLFFMCFNPLLWNLIGYFQFKYQVFSKLTNGNRKFACYCAAAIIFTLGLYRDWIFHLTVRNQPKNPIIFGPLSTYMIAPALWIYGNILVLSSMYRLGIIGTYLGDYFGILMEKKVTGFPFSLMDHPMYYGSTLNFFAYSLWTNSLVGVLLTGVLACVYAIASHFEGKFTNKVYSKHK